MRSKIGNFSFFIFHFFLLLSFFFIFHFVLLPSASAEEITGRLATVGKGGISAEEFELQLERSGAGRGLTVENAERMLRDSVVGEVLYQEALRLKMDKDPEMRQALRQMFSQKLLEKKIIGPAWKRKISEKEVKTYYDVHSSLYNSPEMVRLADIFIAVPEGAGKKVRTEKKRLAAKVLAEAIKNQKARFGFSELISKYSDTHPRYAVGDTGFFDLQGKPVGLEKELAEKAFSMKKREGVFPEVIETALGFHIVKVVSRKSPVTRPVEEVAAEIKQRIRREEEARNKKEYMDRLLQNAGVEVDRKMLQKIVKRYSGRGGARPRSADGPPALPR